jgi:transposase
MNKPLATAYYLKEDLRMLWYETTPKAARRCLMDWIGQAEASGLEELRKMAATLRRHSKGILAYFRFQITSGPMEGMNNKVKVLLRKMSKFSNPWTDLMVSNPWTRKQP